MCLSAGPRCCAEMSISTHFLQVRERSLRGGKWGKRDLDGGQHAFCSVAMEE